MRATVDSATQTPSFEVGSDGDDNDSIEKVMASPRVVIDTSPPFASVEEAVLRFGGRGFWIPRHFDVPTQLHDPEKPGMYKLEDRTTAMLNDLQMKEQETLEILKELELTKQLVDKLKMKLPKEAPEFISLPCLDSDDQISTPDKEHTVKDHVSSQTMYFDEQSNSLPKSTAELIMTELKQTKLHLYQNTNDLAAIRASVESLSKKIEKEKEQVEKPREVNITGNLKPNMLGINEIDNLGGSVNSLLISRELRELNYEAEQFMKTAEAARSEVLTAMSDIEKTKTGLKVIEMRWVAAKKLEEAARAAESLALAEITALSSNDNVAPEHYQQKPPRISLSLEEYSVLTDKARKAENLFKSKDQDDPFRKIEEATEEKLSKMSLEEVISRVEVMNRRKVSADEALRRFGSDQNLRKPFVDTHSEFRNLFQSRPRRDPRLLEAHEFEFMKHGSKPVLKPTTSIGDILSRKLVSGDDLVVGRQGEGVRGGRQRVSLDQMLSQHRRETSPLNRREKDGGGESKKVSSKRKALGFVHISLPLSKPRKNKIQALNLW